MPRAGLEPVAVLEGGDDVLTHQILVFVAEALNGVEWGIENANEECCGGDDDDD